jgi:uncharacterized protein
MSSFPVENLSLFALASLGAIFVGLGKGGLPAIGSLAVPTLSLMISPVTAAALLLPVYVVSDWAGLWLYRHKFSKANLAILIPASIAGVGFGWVTASLFPDSLITLLIGLMGIGFCLSTWLSKTRDASPKPPNIPLGIFWGALSGFTSFVSHAGGPPFQIYVLPQRLEKLVFAGTSTILFAAVNLAKIVPYWQLGQLAPSGLRTAAMLVPIAIAGTVGGAFLTKVIPDKLFFRFVQIMLFGVSLKLVFDGARGLLR